MKKAVNLILKVFIPTAFVISYLIKSVVNQKLFIQYFGYPWGFLNTKFYILIGLIPILPYFLMVRVFLKNKDNKIGNILKKSATVLLLLFSLLFISLGNNATKIVKGNETNMLSPKILDYEVESCQWFLARDMVHGTFPYDQWCFGSAVIKEENFKKLTTEHRLKNGMLLQKKPFILRH